MNTRYIQEDHQHLAMHGQLWIYIRIHSTMGQNPKCIIVSS